METFLFQSNTELHEYVLNVGEREEQLSLLVFTQICGIILKYLTPPISLISRYINFMSQLNCG